MQNYEDIIRRLTEENRRLQDRLDVALNTIALQQEEIQHLKNEIATLKGQKPRPKIPPSALEGPQSKDKQEDKNRMSRGKHPRRKKTNRLTARREWSQATEVNIRQEILNRMTELGRPKSYKVVV